MENQFEKGSRNERESVEGWYYWGDRKLYDPTENHEQTPLKNRLQLRKPREDESPPEQSTKKMVDNQTTHRPNAIELKLHSSLPRNPEKPVGLKPRNSTTSQNRSFTMNQTSVNSRVERQYLTKDKLGRKLDATENRRQLLRARMGDPNRDH